MALEGFQTRPRDPDVPWLTLPKALKEFEEILATLPRSQSALLQEHYEYLREHRKRAALHAN